MPHLTAEESYLQICESSQVEPQKDVISTLKAITITSELDLSSKNLNAWTWQTLAKIIASSKDIRKLNFGNCLIPPRGLAAVLAALSQGTEVQTLDLRGNNIQTTSVTHLGRMLRHNISLTRLSLEWNSLGVFPDTFVMFCDGLSANQSLQVLDLRNNQLSSENANPLAKALTENKVLKSLDVRWNNLGWKGGQLLHNALSINQSLTKVKLQGNCMPMELTVAIEQCCDHNFARVSLMQECAARTDLLARQLKKAEEERSQEVLNLKKVGDETLKQILRASESRIGEMEKTMAEKNKDLEKLQERLQVLDHSLKTTLDTKKLLSQELKEKEGDYQELLQKSQSETRHLREALASKDEQLEQMQLEMRNKASAEHKQRIALETTNLSHTEEINQLEAEVQQMKEKLTRARKLHEEVLLKEQEANKDIIAGLEKECEAKLNKLQSEMNIQRSSLRLRIQELDRIVEEHERNRTELSSALARERARREEEVALANQEARTKETSRFVQLEEKLSALRDEKVSLEKQLALAHSSVLQLQQQNNALIGEMAEPQRKLSQLVEELSNERLLTQRLRQELGEETARLQAKRKDVDRYHDEVSKLEQQLSELEKTRLEMKREHDQERARLASIIEQRDKEIQKIRAEEMERAGVLYSAFNKYLFSLSPSKGNLNVNL